MSAYEGQRWDQHWLKVCPQPGLVLDDALHAIKNHVGRETRELLSPWLAQEHVQLTLRYAA